MVENKGIKLFLYTGMLQLKMEFSLTFTCLRKSKCLCDLLFILAFLKLNSPYLGGMPVLNTLK